MNRNKLKILLPVAVLALGVALAAVIVAARPEVERTPTEVPPPLVRVVEAERHEVTLTVHTQGTTRPSVESSLVAQVSGRVDSVSPDFAEGAFFRRGQTLVQIDPRDYRLAVARAEAQVAQARVRLDREAAEAELARQEWAELGRGEASPLTLREPQLAEAEAGLQAAQADLEQARLNLDRTAVRSLFDGRARGKRVDVGQFVTVGTPLGSVYSTEAAEVRLPVPRAELAFLEIALGADGNDAVQPAVRLTGDLAGRTTSWDARVVRTGSELDPKTRMLSLFARVDDPFQRRPGAAGIVLPMGLFVEAEIVGRHLDGVMPLPRSALRDGDRVLVVDGDERLRFRQVEIARRETDRVLLAGGVEPGERVCVSPLETVVDGMRVRVASGSGDHPPAELETAS